MAAINVEVSLDELRKFVPKFVNATTRQISEELIRQARLLVRDTGDNGLIQITPPKTADQGRKATERDINRVFVNLPTIRSILKQSGQRGALLAFNRYMRPGPDYSHARALDFLNKQTPTLVEVRSYTTKKGKKVRSHTQTRQIPQFGDLRLGRLEYVGDTPSRALHKQRKNSQGRVTQARWSQLVLSKAKMTDYTKQIVKRVGLLKAGWGKAWKSLGLISGGAMNLPEFVSNNLAKASGSGNRNLTDPSNMYIELINTTPNASNKISSGKINWLLGFRQKQIERELGNRLSKTLSTI